MQQRLMTGSSVLPGTLLVSVVWRNVRDVARSGSDVLSTRQYASVWNPQAQHSGEKLVLWALCNLREKGCVSVRRKMKFTRRVYPWQVLHFNHDEPTCGMHRGTPPRDVDSRRSSQDWNECNGSGQITTLCDVTLCSLADPHRRFEEICCFHIQDRRIGGRWKKWVWHG